MTTYQHLPRAKNKVGTTKGMKLPLLPLRLKSSTNLSSFLLPPFLPTTHMNMPLRPRLPRPRPSTPQILSSLYAVCTTACTKHRFGIQYYRNTPEQPRVRWQSAERARYGLPNQRYLLGRGGRQDGALDRHQSGLSVR